MNFIEDKNRQIKEFEKRKYNRLPPAPEVTKYVKKEVFPEPPPEAAEPTPKLVKLFDILRQYSTTQITLPVTVEGHDRYRTVLSHKPWKNKNGVPCQWSMTLPMFWNAEQMLKYILQHEKDEHGKRIKIREDEEWK